MRRREFLALLGSAVGGSHLAVNAQPPGPVRRLAVLMGAAETPSSRRWLTSFFIRSTNPDRASVATCLRRCNGGTLDQSKCGCGRLNSSLVRPLSP